MPTAKSESVVPLEMLELVGGIYQAAMEPGHWQSLTQRITRLVGADFGHLFTPTEGLTQRFLHASENIANEGLELYSAHYWQHDIWRVRALETGSIKQGLIQTGEELIGLTELRKTEFFIDFMKPFELEQLLVNILFDESSSKIAPRTHLSFMRKPGRKPFSEQEKSVMRVLMPHLQRSLALHWRAKQDQLNRQAHEQALNQLSYGLVLLGQDGKVVYLNRIAQDMLDGKEGLGLRNGRLQARVSVEALLAKFVNDALGGVGGSLYLERPPGKKPFHLLAAPLAERHLFLHIVSMPVATILIQAPEPRSPQNGLAAFATLYGLTPAEMRVLEYLIQGLVPKQIASECAVSVHTVRTYLASLYAKTGTSSQRELVALAG